MKFVTYRDAEGASGDANEFALGVGFRRLRRFENARGYHAFRKIV